MQRESKWRVKWSWMAIALLFLAPHSFAEGLMRPMQTTYQISRDQVQVATTVVSASPRQVDLLKGFLAQQVLPQMQNLPGVVTVSFGLESAVVRRQAGLVQRSFPVILALGWPEVRQVIGQAVETVRECESGAAAGCVKQSWIQVLVRGHEWVHVELTQEDEKLRIESRVSSEFYENRQTPLKARTQMFLQVARMFRASNEQIARL